VAAGGGDGTVNAVAGKLVGTDTALGVLLMGTLNHFAKDVGIPQNLEAAVRNIFTGHVVNVDVGEVNGRAAFGSYRKPKKSPVSLDRDILTTYPLFLLNKGCPRGCQLLLLL
jgi:hypothetical protein